MFGYEHDEELLTEVEDLRERIRELEAEHARGLRLDSVTGLLSARALRGCLAEECERAQRYRRPLCVAVLAVDDFEDLELRHGFKAGDDLVSAVADRLRASTRSHDVLGRTGGIAEFAVLLPDTDAEAALPGLERLLVDLELTGEGTMRAAGASMGIAALQRGMSAEVLLASARHALGESGEHSEAVIEMAVSVARTLGCDAVEVERVRSAAILHDIGKVAIPDEILHKPGPLNDEEWQLMRQHPVIGERILRVLPGLGAVARMVRHEHERWDGGGYPDGLSGVEIPFGSRVILAADAYHAITSDRPYRAAKSHEHAVEELTRCSGTQFDPDVTAALIVHLGGRRQSGVISA